MFKVRSISLKVNAAVIVLMLAFLVMGALYVRPIIGDYFITTAWKDQRNAAANAAHTIEYAFRNAEEEIKTTAWMDDMRSMSYGRMHDLLVKQAWVSTFYDAFFVADLRGVYIDHTSTPQKVGTAVYARELEWVHKALEGNQTVFVNLNTDIDGVQIRGFATPIYPKDGNKPTGVLVGLIRVTYDAPYIATVTDDKVGQRGRVMVVGEDGQILTASHSGAKASPQERLPVSLVTRGEQGFVEHQAEGLWWLAAYRPIKGIPWGVVVEQPREDVEATIRNASATYITAAIVVFGLLAAIQTIAITKALSPLSRLLSAMRQRRTISSAEFPDDEIGHIAAEMNSLFAEARDANLLLDKRVAERTEELSQTNALLSEEVAERRKSEERFRLVASESGVLVWEVDAQGTITYISRDSMRMFGLRPEELVGKHIIDVFLANAPESAKKAAASAFSHTHGFRDHIRTLTLPDGRAIYVETSASAIMAEDGSFKGYRGSIRDITDKVVLDRQMKTSLREKEILLREIHHRVKNNMQIVTSLMNLQSRLVKDPEALTAFSESMSRLKAMAMIHEEIFRSDTLDQVSAANYIRSLANYWLRLSQEGKRIRLSLDLADAALDINVLMPLGLMLNDLISNAMAHAFVGRDKGEIRIALIPAEGGYRLEFSDNGVGLPKGVDASKASTLGLRLIYALTEQLDGSIACSSGEGGTSFVITFPYPGKASTPISFGLA